MDVSERRGAPPGQSSRTTRESDGPHSRSSGADFKTRDAASYETVAQEFDRFTEQLVHPIAGQLVARAGLQSADRVLDVGTGTGVVALRAAQAVPEGWVCGIDLSEAMLVVARAKAARARLQARVEFRRMDAENLELAAGSFDAVLSLFALLHFPNPERALAEMKRVLRPGGRLVVAVGSAPPPLSPRWWVEGMRHASSLLGERRGLLLRAPHFLDALVDRRLRPDETRREPEQTDLAARSRNRSRTVRRWVRAAGFERVATGWAGHRVAVESVDDFWDVQRTFSSFARKRLDGVLPDGIGRVRREFEEICEKVLRRGGKLVYPFGACMVAARRPL
jgi:ubiquinone/menaquinone biosynthesis C-methylase UbiE